MGTTALTTLASRFTNRSIATTEADVQTGIAAFLTLAPLGLTADHISSVEEPLGDGTRRRIDIAFGKLLIEVKKDISKKEVLDPAINQLRGYLEARHSQDGYLYAGILTDGRIWKLFGSNPDAGFTISEADTLVLDPADSNSAEKLSFWLDTILLTGEPVPASPKAIRERLGTGSPRYKLDRNRLENIYLQNVDSPFVETKKQLWARLLRTALGTSFEDSVGLFIDHTLLVIEAEIIAHLLIGVDPSTLSGKAILSGDIFHQAGITNVVEADFFDWIAEVPGGEEFLSELCRELQQFDWRNVEHDVLKILYESIIDKEVRKNLGEYYTPDWLASEIVKKEIINPLEQKVIDPSCGSGTFVFHAIKVFLDSAEERGLQNADALDLLQKRVFGMDLHPVSVVLARVTYLLAIGTERLKDRRTIHVPIFLGDSIQWTRNANLVRGSNLVIEISGEDLANVQNEQIQTLFELGESLEFPISSISDPQKFDLMVSDLADLASTHTSVKANLPDPVPLLQRYGYTADTEKQTLIRTFEKLAMLNAQGKNHIWGYYIRNLVRPLWLSMPENRVDLLIGNPPWLAYRFMTSNMQNQFKKLSQNRNLWASSKVATQQDLVGLFIARTVEQFLKIQGRFAYVTPFAVLSRLQYEGFRTGKWADSAPNGLDSALQSSRVDFDAPWDLSNVKPDPFPVPSAVIFGTRSLESSQMPRLTKKVTRKDDAIIFQDSETASLSATTTHRSPYGKIATQGAILTPRVLLMVDRREETSFLGKSAGQSLVGSSRSSLEKSPWADLPSIESPVEDEYIFKVLTGSSIGAFRALSSIEAVLPISGGRLLQQKDLATKSPLMAARWMKITETWDLHKGKSKLSMLENINYQGKLGKQFPVPNFRVVYTTSGSKLAACLIDDTSAVIDTKLYWIPVEDRQEGNYLVGFLNSRPLMEKVAKVQSRGNFGARDIHTLPFNFSIPKFAKNNSEHILIANLADELANLAKSLVILDSTKFVAARKQLNEVVEASVLKGQLDDLCREILEDVLG